MTALTAACGAAITGGFTSVALGASHRYGSSASDQGNLDADMMAAATDSTVAGSLTCSTDAGATWAEVVHSAAQIGQVWKDFRAFRIACQAKRSTLTARVASSTSAAAMAAIVWTT